MATERVPDTLADLLPGAAKPKRRTMRGHVEIVGGLVYHVEPRPHAPSGERWRLEVLDYRDGVNRGLRGFYSDSADVIAPAGSGIRRLRFDLGTKSEATSWITDLQSDVPGYIGEPGEQAHASDGYTERTLNDWRE